MNFRADTLGWALAALLLSACAAGPLAPAPGAAQPYSDPAPAPRASMEPAPASPALVTPAGEAIPDDPARLVYFDDRRGGRLPGGLSERDFQTRTLGLDFVDAPAADVVRAVIGEALGEPVSVASNISGRITLTAPEPAPVRAALQALEAVLAESGLALVERTDGFLLTSADQAAQGAARPGARLGFGARITPVRHTTPNALLALIEPFITPSVSVNADDESGLLILTGPGPDVAAAAEAAALFDTPALSDRVFGLFELRFADARTAASELDAVLTASGMTPGTARILPLPRLNLLFVATRTRSQFDDAQAWLTRFDQPSGGDERRLRYYVARNTPSTALARQITAAFAGGETAAGAAGLPRFAGAAEGQAGQAPGQDGGQDSEQGSRLTVIADELNNGLIIRATDQEYREIVDLVDRMDVMPPQVLIEATIAEVRLTDALSFGVRWFFETRGGEGDGTIGFTNDSEGGAGPVFPGFNYAFVGADINAALSALNAVTDVSVLSAPSIMVQNNQTANLQVGDEVPIVTQTAQSVTDPGAPIVSTVELRETGVILQVSPRINASGMVVLDVMQEVSSVRPNNTSGIDSPTIQQLRFTSTVAVRSRATIALGGLIRESETTSGSGVPGLSRIPGLGAAFRSRSTTTERSELVIFLTPRIINSDDDQRSALNDLRRDMRALEARQPGLFDQ
ncbi:type II secretion system secretin GspD [Maricaulaceae bacterium MS644]